ncbi:winged helix-turn-helix transcriptional regulator [Propionispora hippei]|uniref:winged helix-turn-helix transcriptional regulator n=1 Tax=Propionispora hippei TaxID=209080 RepID=UPI00293153D1|nr:helix-turn-helix domain-containing protein [Propionispora hippei]
MNYFSDKKFAELGDAGMREELEEVQFLNQEDVEDYINTVTALQVIQGKWKTLIIWQICSGQVRFNELRRMIPKASQKMLSQHLRELEQAGVIQRKVYPENPPKVEYSLTELGHTLEPVFEKLREWGELYRCQMSPQDASHMVSDVVTKR